MAQTPGGAWACSNAPRGGEGKWGIEIQNKCCAKDMMETTRYSWTGTFTISPEFPEDSELPILDCPALVKIAFFSEVPKQLVIASVVSSTGMLFGDHTGEDEMGRACTNKGTAAS